MCSLRRLLLFRQSRHLAMLSTYHQRYSNSTAAAPTHHVIDDANSIPDRTGLKALTRYTIDKVCDDAPLLCWQSVPVNTFDLASIIWDWIRMHQHCIRSFIWRSGPHCRTRLSCRVQKMKKYKNARGNIECAALWRHPSITRSVARWRNLPPALSLARSGAGQPPKLLSRCCNGRLLGLSSRRVN